MMLVKKDGDSQPILFRNIDEAELYMKNEQAKNPGVLFEMTSLSVYLEEDPGLIS